MCDYEAIRLRNLEDNRRILASFGLLDPFKSLPHIIKRDKRPVHKPQNAKRKLIDSNTASDFTGGSVYGTRRKSARLQESGCAVTYEELEADAEQKKQVPRVPINRPNFYGEIAGVEVGSVWETRLECCRDGIHRPTVAGIHGGEDGAYSIALSGGYEDDLDLGDCFTYTGEGGRDLKGTKSNPKNLRTAPQSKEQTLTRGNLALSKNVETKNPVRVIRGYKLDSPFAPEEGYRYDGLYTVEKCWFTTGLSGFGVWKFALRRCPGQAPPPWQFSDDVRSPKEDKLHSASLANGNQENNYSPDQCIEDDGNNNVKLKDKEVPDNLASCVEDRSDKKMLQEVEASISPTHKKVLQEKQ